MSIVKFTQAKDNDLLFLIQGKDKLGGDAFYYLLVDKIKKHIFLKEIENSVTDLRKFGKILISGFGVTPNEDSKAYIKNKFGFDV